eukprot:3801436-Rhodomonas_salina.1
MREVTSRLGARSRHTDDAVTSRLGARSRRGLRRYLLADKRLEGHLVQEVEHQLRVVLPRGHVSHASAHGHVTGGW